MKRNGSRWLPAFPLTTARRARFPRTVLFLVAVFTGLLMLEGTASAEPPDLAAVINKAGRQRMLSQRVVKAYCQTGLDVRAGEASRQLHEAVALFDVQLSELKAAAPNRGVLAGLETEEAAWKPVREIVIAPYSREGAKTLVEKSEALLKSAQHVVLLLEQASGRNTVQLVNIAGRQRMLSQRIAKFYMLREAGINDASIGSGLKQAAQEFKEAHAMLKSAPENTEEIKSLLGIAETQWQLLEFSINNDKPILAEFVAVTTDKILGTMDLVAQGYESLYRKSSASGSAETK